MVTYERKINGIEVKASYSEENINEIFLPLLRHLTVLQKRENRRIIAFLAAPPATGKSTLLSFLQYLSEINAEIEPIDSLGMDGFHHYQDYLLSHVFENEEGIEQPLVKIKGAPCTFHVSKLEKNIIALKENQVCTWPIYDRMLHNPMEDAITVSRNIVIIEGNYLLLNREPWQHLAQYADYTIRISAQQDQLLKRLIDRKMKSGNSYQQAYEFVYKSDLENVKLCQANSVPADVHLKLQDDGTYAMDHC